MFLLATLALIVIGFFFPPAWLILVGGLIYFFASHKSRRADAVESRIKRMVAAGKTQAVSSDLFFEAALSYAVSKGAKTAEKDAASTYFVVEGTTYFVVFTRAASGGTMISVRKLTDVRDEMAKHIKFGSAHMAQGQSDERATSETGSVAERFEVGGVTFQGDPDSDEVMAVIIHKITDEVDNRLKIDQQSYYYVMEEAEWLAGKSSFCQEVLGDSGLLEIEYKGARDRARNSSDKRDAAAYMEADVWPELLLKVGDTKAKRIRAQIFDSILNRNRVGVDTVRGMYAKAVANHLMDSGNSDADVIREWIKVMKLVIGRSLKAS